MTLTVGQVAALPDLGLIVRTSQAPLDRAVRWVAVSELADPAPWLDGGELLLTTGMGMAAGDDPQAAAAYVGSLVEAQVAALGFGVGIHHPVVPPALLDAADEHGLPILEVPRPVPFVAVGKAVLRLLTEEEYAESAASFEAQRTLIRRALQGDSAGAAERVVGLLGKHVGGFALLLGPSGQLRHAYPASASGRADDVAGEVLRLRPRGLLASASLADRDEHIVILPVGTHGAADGFLVVGSGRPLRTADQAVMNLAVSILSWLGSLPTTVGGDPLMWHTLALSAFVSEGLEPGIVTALGLDGLDPSRAVAFAIRGVSPDAIRRDLEGAASVLVAADPNGQLQGICPADVPDALVAMARSSGVASVGISQAHDLRQPAQVTRALRQAQTAAASGRGLRTFGDDAGGALSLVDPATARAWASGMLAGLLANPEGAELALTVQAWLARNGQVDAAATDLGVHRHTVRHRLRRAEALLGRSLEDPTARADIWQALSVMDIEVT